MAKGNSALGAVIWGGVERASTQIVSFVLSIILARFLSPNDYGVIGLTSIFIVFSNVFIDSGFSNALIRKQDRNEKDFATAFYFNLIAGILVYIILCLATPFIADFFKEDLLLSIVPIVALNVLFNSLCIVQNAILTARLNIRLQTLINLASQVPAGVLSVIMAYYGYGVYALAMLTVGASFLKMILLWLFAAWRPKERFSRASFNYLWEFGSKLLTASLIGSIFGEVYSVLIGKYIGKSQLGYYSKARGLDINISSVTVGIVQKVSLPILSKYQNDPIELRERFREVMKFLVMFTSAISGFVVFNAHDIVCLLWSSKWEASTPILQLLSVSSVWAPIGSLSLILLQVVGRTDILLKLEFPKKAIYIVIIYISFQYGITGLVVGQIFINIVAAIVNIIPTKRILDYSVTKQFVDIMRYIVLFYSIGFICSFIHISEISFISILVFACAYFPIIILSLILIKDKIFFKYAQMVFHKKTI